MQVQSCKALSVTPDKLFFATMSEIFYLYLTPYEIQIQKCLAHGCVDDAVSIFNQHVPSYDKERPKKLEQLRIDATWPLIKELSFKSAKTNILETNFDPREILMLFPECLSNAHRISDPSKKYTTINMIISDTLNSKLTSKKEEFSKEVAKNYKTAKEFLMEILENRRVFNINIILINFKDN